MLKINKKVEYAMISLKFMSQRNTGELTSTREICDKFNIPFDTTAKVLQIMNNKGILESFKGIKGGYSLNKNLTEYSFMDLSNMIEGKNKSTYCMGTDGVCDLIKICNIITPMDNLFTKIKNYLEELTLEELLINENIATSKIAKLVGNN